MPASQVLVIVEDPGSRMLLAASVMDRDGAHPVMAAAEAWVWVAQGRLVSGG